MAVSGGRSSQPVHLGRWLHRPALLFHLIANIIVKEKCHLSRQAIDIKMMFLFLPAFHSLMLIKPIVTACIGKQIEFLNFLRAHILYNFLE